MFMYKFFFILYFIRFILFAEKTIFFLIKSPQFTTRKINHKTIYNTRVSRMFTVYDPVEIT